MNMEMIGIRCPVCFLASAAEECPGSHVQCAKEDLEALKHTDAQRFTRRGRAATKKRNCLAQKPVLDPIGWPPGAQSIAFAVIPAFAGIHLLSISYALSIMKIVKKIQETASK